MAGKPTPRPTPYITGLVIYRNNRGVDMPAIITKVATVGEDEIVHVHPFPPPGEAGDFMSQHWGVQEYIPETELDPAPQTWRWPDHV